MIDPNTLQGKLAACSPRAFREVLGSDPVILQLPDGTERNCELRLNIWGTKDETGYGGVEFRLDSEGASSLGLGATVSVHTPEVRWRAVDGSFPIRPAHVTHSSSGGDDRGETEATIYLLTLGKELRDQFNAEAKQALAPVIEEMMADLARRDAEREAVNRRYEALSARLAPYIGTTVRVTRRDGSRVAGALLEKARTMAVQTPSGKERSVGIDEVLLFEVKVNGRFQPFALEPVTA